MTGAGLDSPRRSCFRCWEIFEEEGGPQADPHEHPRATNFESNGGEAD